MSAGRLTIILVSPVRGRMRQFRISRFGLGVGILLFVGSLAIGGYGLYLKLTHSKQAQELARLKRLTQKQREEMQELASRMEGLKAQLVKLHQLDRRIRIIANLEEGGPTVEGVEGIGGVNPEESVLASLERERQEAWTNRLRKELGSIQALAHRQEKSFRALEEMLKEKRDLLVHTPSIWPTRGWLTCGFGYRRSPFTGLREFHRGLDIATRKGTPVLAPADGVVVKTGKDRGFGNFVRLDHGFGYRTFYAHLQEIKVKPGQKVHRGQVIATVGNTGRSTGPHLHYEVHLNGLAVNPLRYVLN